MKHILFTLLVLICSSLGAVSFCETAPKGVLINLEDAISQVLKDHGMVKLIEARLSKERSLLRAAQKSGFPKVRSELSTAFVTDGGLGMLFSTSEVTLPLFEGGRRLHEVRKRKLALQKETHLGELAREDLVYQVKAVYISVLREKEMLILAIEWSREVKRLLEIMEELARQELIQKEDLLKVKTLFREANFERVKHKQSFDYHQSLLMDLLSIQEGFKIRLEPLPRLVREKVDLKKFLEELYDTHPLYRTLDLEVKEAHEELAILASGRYPKLYLSPRYHLARDSYLDQNRFEFGISGSWDIWDFGALGERLKAKEAEVKELEASRTLKIDTLKDEARKSVSELNTAWERIRLAKASCEEMKTRYQNERMRFITEESDEKKLFYALRELVKAKITLLDAIAGYRLSQAGLARLKGA